MAIMMAIAVAVAASHSRTFNTFTLEENCGKFWSAPFISTVVRLDIVYIQTSKFNQKNFSFEIERFCVISGACV